MRTDSWCRFSVHPEFCSFETELAPRGWHDRACCTLAGRDYTVPQSWLSVPQLMDERGCDAGNDLDGYGAFAVCEGLLVVDALELRPARRDAYARAFLGSTRAQASGISRAKGC